MRVWYNVQRHLAFEYQISFNYLLRYEIVLIFGRPFVEQFALCYQTTVVCLSVLSVCPDCDVGVLWPNDWMDQGETRRAGRLGPGHIVLDGDPAPPPQRGTAPNFRPISVMAK